MVGICEEGSQREKQFVFPSNSDKTEELTMKGEMAGAVTMANPDASAARHGRARWYPLTNYGLCTTLL